MNERDYFRAIREVREEFEIKVKALEMAWRLLNKTEPPKAKKAKHKSDPDWQVATKGLPAAIAAIVIEMPSEFTTVDVDKILRANYTEFAKTGRSAVSHTLKRVAERLEIACRLGAGKRPTTYMKQPQGVQATSEIDSAENR
jgi:hypothetical protein